MWAEAGIYYSFSGLISVFFRTNQFRTNLLFKLDLLKLLKKKYNSFSASFKTVSKLFQTISQAHFLKHSTQVIYKWLYFKFKKFLTFLFFNYFSPKLQDILKFKICPNVLGETKKFFNWPKMTRSNQKV